MYSICTLFTQNVLKRSKMNRFVNKRNPYISMFLIHRDLFRYKNTFQEGFENR
nr:MAG TPA: hypothetical protein [Caudoviricetes sp.]